MKKILTIALVWLAALAVFVSPADAKPDKGENPLAVAVDEMKIKVSNFNFGFVRNDVFAQANTGFNLTLGRRAEVDTGNAAVGATVGNGMNSNTTVGNIADAEWGPFAVNFGYGNYESGKGNTQVPQGCYFPMPCWMKMALDYWKKGNPVAIAWDNAEIEVKNINFGFVSNKLLLSANTGSNFTFGSEVSTGDAAVTASVGNTLNTNTTSISFYEGGVGPVAVNFEFGLLVDAGFGHRKDHKSVPLAVAVESDEISVNNSNFGKVKNNVNAQANTGWNITSGRRTEVETGNASITTGLSNTVNTNTTSVSKTDMAVGPVAVNARLGEECGGLTGLPCLPAGGIGPVAANIGTSGVAVAVETDEIEVKNENKAVVTNNETLVANTGSNVTTGSSGCGGATAVETGNATVTTTVTNTVNTNSTTITVGEGAR